MKHVSIKKLEKTSLELALAVLEVQRWSAVLAGNLDKKKEYNLCTLHEEAQKIEDFARQLKEAIALRRLWVNQECESTPSGAWNNYGRG